MAILFSGRRQQSLLRLLYTHRRSFFATAQKAVSAAEAKSLLRSELDPDKSISILSSISSTDTTAGRRDCLDITVRRLFHASRKDDVKELISSLKASPQASEEPFLNDLIYAYGSVRMPQLALSLFQEIPTLTSSPPTVVAFNVLLQAHSIGGKASKIPYLFRALSEQHSIIPNSQSYTLLVRALCKTGKLPSALQILTEMGSKGITPTSTIYTTLINSHYKHKKPAEAEKIWADAVTKGWVPDVVAYNAKANDYARRGTLEDVQGVIAEIKSAGLKPNAHSYNSLLVAYCKNNQSEDAKKLYTELLEMDDDKVASKITCNIYINYLCDSGDLETTVKVLNDAIRMEKIPDVGTIVFLVEKLVEGSRVEDAKAVFGELRNKLGDYLVPALLDIEKKHGLDA